jgi:hypothetical protein
LSALRVGECLNVNYLQFEVPSGRMQETLNQRSYTFSKSSVSQTVRHQQLPAETIALVDMEFERFASHVQPETVDFLSISHFDCHRPTPKKFDISWWSPKVNFCTSVSCASWPAALFRRSPKRLLGRTMGQYERRLVTRRFVLKWCYRKIHYQKRVITREEKHWKNNKNIVLLITKDSDFLTKIDNCMRYEHKIPTEKYTKRIWCEKI